MNKAVLNTGVDKSKLEALKAQSKANKVSFVRISPKKKPLDTGLGFYESRLSSRDISSSHFEESLMERKSKKLLLNTGLDQSTVLEVKKSKLSSRE